MMKAVALIQQSKHPHRTIIAIAFPAILANSSFSWWGGWLIEQSLARAPTREDLEPPAAQEPDQRLEVEGIVVDNQGGVPEAEGQVQLAARGLVGVLVALPLVGLIVASLA